MLWNGTIYDNEATHVGQVSLPNRPRVHEAAQLRLSGLILQMFFDTDLTEEVEATSPYSSNTQTVTANSEDSILEQQSESIDPVLEVSLILLFDVREAYLTA